MDGTFSGRPGRGTQTTAQPDRLFLKKFLEIEPVEEAPGPKQQSAPGLLNALRRWFGKNKKEG
jgi:hypothetical protein